MCNWQNVVKDVTCQSTMPLFRWHDFSKGQPVLEDLAAGFLCSRASLPSFPFHQSTAVFGVAVVGSAVWPAGHV